MTVYKRKHSKNYFCQFQHRGKTIIRSCRTTNITLAKRFETKLKNEIYKRDELDEKPPIKLYGAFDLYDKLKKKTASYRTTKSRIKMLKEYLVDKDLHTLTQSELERFVYQRMSDGAAAGTARLDISALRGAIQHADKMGYNTPNIKEYPKVKVDNKRVRFLSVDEEKLLLKELNPNRLISGGHSKHVLQDNHDFVVLLLDTGMRYNELATLQWKDVNLDNGTIRIWRSKTSSETILHMTDRAYNTFSKRYDHKIQSKWVFCRNDNPSQHRGYTVQSIRNAMMRAKLGDFTIHDLRHTFCSRLAQAGMSLQEIALLSGHQNLQTVQIYAHLIPTDVSRKAVDVLNHLNG